MALCWPPSPPPLLGTAEVGTRRVFLFAMDLFSNWLSRPQEWVVIAFNEKGKISSPLNAGEP